MIAFTHGEQVSVGAPSSTTTIRDSSGNRDLPDEANSAGSTIPPDRSMDVINSVESTKIVGE